MVYLGVKGVCGGEVTGEERDLFVTTSRQNGVFNLNVIRLWQEYDIYINHPSSVLDFV